MYRRDITVKNSVTTDTDTYLLGGLYERVIHHSGLNTGKVEERHYVGSAIVTYSHDKGGNTARNGTEERRRFTHTDHLGSIVAITDEIGMVVERMSFDAWGKRRAVEMPTLQTVLQSDPYNFSMNPFDLKSRYTDKGFTGHQQLDGVGIIHMGGRIYDAEIGRFLQADPFVQDRTNLQALNRYSYVENNPLSYTDPSGYFLKKLLKKAASFRVKLHKKLHWEPVKKSLQRIARVKWLSTVITVVLNFIPGCQVWCAALFNGAMAMANGGTISDTLKGAAIGAVTSWLGGQIAGGLEAGMNSLTSSCTQAAFKGAQYAGMALAGGISAKAQGGKFIDGVKGAAVGVAIGAAIKWALTPSSQPPAKAGSEKYANSDTVKVSVDFDSMTDQQRLEVLQTNLAEVASENNFGDISDVEIFLGDDADFDSSIGEIAFAEPGAITVHRGVAHLPSGAIKSILGHELVHISDFKQFGYCVQCPSHYASEIKAYRWELNNGSKYSPWKGIQSREAWESRINDAILRNRQLFDAL